MNNQFFLRHADISHINVLTQVSPKAYLETFMKDLSIPYPENNLDTYFRSLASPEILFNKIIDPKRTVWLIEDT
ncbi:unnamed protein product, partial [Rotaria sordida]